MKWPILRLEILAAFLTVLVLLSFSYFIVQAVDRINDGQRAVVCILAIAPDQRTQADVVKCLAANNLGDETNS